MTALIVEKEPGAARQGGITIPEAGLPKLGYKGVESTEVVFEDHRVPASTILGGPEGEGQGFYQMMSGIETGRINVGARGLGVALRAYELAIRYAQERSAFGKPIAQHQLIQAKLADMATGIEAAKHLIAAAARKKDAGGEQTWRPAWRSSSRPRSPSAASRSRCASTAATATRRSSRSSASTATTPSSS